MKKNIIPAFCGLLVLSVSVWGYSRLQGSCPGEGTFNLEWRNPNGTPYDRIYINPNCTDDDTPGLSERDAVMRAMNTWNSGEFDFSFVYAGLTDHAPFHSGDDPDNTDEMSVVGWYPGSLGMGVIARTWVIFECDGEIVETDIEFADLYPWAATEGTHPSSTYDVETVALHELGHALGLDHSIPPAIMQPTINTWDERRTLTPDDLAGGLAIYGEGSSFSFVESYRALR